MPAPLNGLSIAAAEASPTCPGDARKWLEQQVIQAVAGSQEEAAVELQVLLCQLAAAGGQVCRQVEGKGLGGVAQPDCTEGRSKGKGGIGQAAGDAGEGTEGSMRGPREKRSLNLFKV